MKTKYMISLILFIVSIISCGIYAADYKPPTYPMIVSINSGGNYVLTSNYDNKVILWNILQHNKTAVSNNANFNSAYFIKDSNDFIWQDQKQMVHVEDITGQIIKTFSNFVVYGQVMASDLRAYFAADQNRNLYSGVKDQQKTIAKRSQKSSFWNVEKLPQLLFTNDNKHLLSCLPNDKHSKFGGVVLWGLNKDKPLHKFSGNTGKTYIAISPDDKYLVSGDEGGRIFVWNLATGRLINKTKFVRKEAKNAPDNLKNGDLDYDQILAIKFIDKKGHYLLFTQGYSYAMLYSINSQNPIKYFNLGENPAPKLDKYVMQNIDTAPEANILVIGQADSDGIIVYKFDSKNLLLQKTWASA